MPTELMLMARVARLLDDRRRIYGSLERVVAEVEGWGCVVSGERSKLLQLQAVLNGASQGLEAIETSEDPAHSVSTLETILGQLTEVDWEVGEFLLAELESRKDRQEAVIRDHQVQLAELQAVLSELRDDFDAPGAARAPVTAERRAMWEADDLAKRAERALREQNFDEVSDSLRSIRSKTESLRNVSQVVREKVNESAAFSRQADLLLLKSPSDSEGRFKYTVLLRTPSDPGSHGINIQESSTLVDQDRENMQELVDQVTNAVNTRLSRQFGKKTGFWSRGSLVPKEDEERVEDADMEGELDGSSEVSRDLPPGGTPPPIHGPSEQADVEPVIAKVGDFMYRTIMPEGMQRYLPNTPCSLTITSNDLELPWELMCLEGVRPLCIDRPIGRMPMGRAYPREEPKAIAPSGTLKFLLVYSDPERNLPKAQEEVWLIRDELLERWKGRNEVDVEVLEAEEATGRALNDRLAGGDFDVLHYAGHAYFDKDDPDQSGLLLHNKEVFMAQKIRRLLRGRPLVFLNACQTGRTANEQVPQEVGGYLQRPAEGIASAFIYGGALGCVGSLWPVYDTPAAEFALKFYEGVIEGYMIGEAMRRARLVSRNKHPKEATWASFVLYGDPTFTLVA